MSEKIAVACIKAIKEIGTIQIEKGDEEGAIESINAMMGIVGIRDKKND